MAGAGRRYRRYYGDVGAGNREALISVLEISEHLGCTGELCVCKDV